VVAATLLFASLAGASSLGYDPGADPAAELRSAVAEARAGDKRILVLVGGEWCSWCHILDRFVKENVEVRDRWDRGFVTLKVHWDPDRPNEEFLGRYPGIDGYPHLFVLDSDGTFLHSQNTAELEDGSSYSLDLMTGFLERWAPRSKRGRR
jgi:thioredoxin-related protein